ncbi:MAG: ribosome maturation factor RimM [Bacteroidota bacterium]|nr:ribosome maturation factor RimM [Bacteroidota bacterium]
MPLWQLNNPVTAGKIVKSHGYLGYFRVAFLMSGLKGNLESGEFIFLPIDKKPVPFLLENIIWENDDTARLKLKGIDSDEAVKKYLESEIILDGEQYDIDEEEEDELIDLEVIDVDTGAYLGRVVEVQDNNGQELITVSYHGATYYIPLVDEIVLGIDDKEGKLIVRLPEGLMDLD